MFKFIYSSSDLNGVFRIKKTQIRKAAPKVGSQLTSAEARKSNVKLVNLILYTCGRKKTGYCIIDIRWSVRCRPHQCHQLWVTKQHHWSLNYRYETRSSYRRQICKTQIGLSQFLSLSLLLSLGARKYIKMEPRLH